jgi:cob(I)alamin adenosyltransferase
MKKASVYTRTGDLGTTGLVSGTRVKKYQDRIALYGEVDELNSVMGLAISLLDEKFDTHFLHAIQSSLFDLGSNFACEENMREQYHLPKITENLIALMEKEIDMMDAELPPLKNFILPGGTKAAAAFHVCRTVCRRLERNMVSFQDKLPQEISVLDLTYINRLSDYFFILSRFINIKANTSETAWIPKKT